MLTNFHIHLNDRTLYTTVSKWHTRLQQAVQGF